MIERVGPYFVWALFLAGVYRWAEPALVFIAGAGVVFAVILGVTKKLEEQSGELGKSWNKSNLKESKKED